MYCRRLLASVEIFFRSDSLQRKVRSVYELDAPHSLLSVLLVHSEEVSDTRQKTPCVSFFKIVRQIPIVSVDTRKFVLL